MNIVDLLVKALPEDITLSEIKLYGKEEWWENKITLAIVYALRKFERFNWEAYLENNQDVKASGIDPVLHFIRYGIYESRKLYSWHKLREPVRLDAPLVTVIVPNYNISKYLAKCLRSLRCQTLHNIEVIIVDDGSTDDSVTVITLLIDGDQRFNLLTLDYNCGSHYARKFALTMARGDYIMFLDSDDYFTPDACEVAWSAVKKGYDIGIFNCVLINNANLSEIEIIEAQRYFNRGNAGQYCLNLTDFTYKDKQIAHNLNLKIYLRELIQHAFMDLGDIHLVAGEDKYAFFAISTFARNFIKIDDAIYCYVRDTGVSLGVDYRKRLYSLW